MLETFQRKPSTQVLSFRENFCDPHLAENGYFAKFERSCPLENPIDRQIAMRHDQVDVYRRIKIGELFFQMSTSPQSDIL
jgi:hypothetical protein